MKWMTSNLGINNERRASEVGLVEDITHAREPLAVSAGSISCSQEITTL